MKIIPAPDDRGGTTQIEKSKIFDYINDIKYNRQTGGMSLLAIEKELDERIDLITANLDYVDILWPFSRKKRYFDTSQPIYDYTLKILLKM